MSFVSTDIILQIKKLPDSPGVYIFKDSKEQVLYVGKAKSLKKRVASYARYSEEFKIVSLQESAFFLEVKIVKTELAALLLEAKLIQAFQPKLNVLLKVGHPFYYFLFTKDKVPKFLLARDTKQKGFYVGPFLNKTAARDIFEFLTKIFSLRICKSRISNGCLYYHLGQCSGFCMKDFNMDRYLKNFNTVKKLCQEGPRKFIKKSWQRIEMLNSELRFEEAEELNDQIVALKSYSHAWQEAKSFVQLSQNNSFAQHIWMYDKNLDLIMIFSGDQQHIKRQKTIFLQEIQEQDFAANILELQMFDFYRDNPAADVIFTSFKTSQSDMLKDFVSKLQRKSIELMAFDPSAKDNALILNFCKELFDQETKKILDFPFYLQNILSLPAPAFKIDCFDISHHQDLSIVGACVRYEFGQFNTQKFRLFKVRQTSTPNDYLSLQEVVLRRYSGKDKEDVPDLILIDGGKGQLSSVVKILPQFTMASLAKREERVFRPEIQLQNAENKELLSKDGYKLDLLSPADIILTSIRDRTHNFVINFHRRSKNKIEE